MSVYLISAPQNTATSECLPVMAFDHVVIAESINVSVVGPDEIDTDAVAIRQKAKKEVILGFLQQRPVISYACKNARVGRTTFYRMCNSDPAFKTAAGEAMAQGILAVNDLSESKIIRLIKAGYFPAIRFWLQSHSATYSHKLELAGRVAIAEEPLTEEEKDIIERAIRDALPAQQEPDTDDHEQ